MRRYSKPLGGAHMVLGAVTAALSLVPLGLAALLLLTSLQRIGWLAASLLLHPESWIPVAQDLVELGLLLAALGLPGLVALAASAVQVFAGVGLWRGWPAARWAVLAAALPNLLVGVPGIALSVGAWAALGDRESAG